LFDGILLDLGVSSHQFDDPSRGFTFREGAPLDMRMGDDADVGADELLNTIDEVDLSALLRAYADEPRAARLSREIVRRRERRPFATADDLVDAIRAVLGPRSGAPDFARIFQAVRIAVNQELTGLEAALPRLRDRLTPRWRVGHHHYPLRRRPPRESTRSVTGVRRAFVPRGNSSAPAAPWRWVRTLTKRPINAEETEVEHNPRARSARLRAWRQAT
jgi:16S rRNA (cytosine1402-N4)-methyltransferase